MRQSIKFPPLRGLLEIVIFAFGWLHCAAGQDEARPLTDHVENGLRWSVIGECQMIVLGQKAALKMLPQLNDPATIEAAYAQLEAMIEKDEAKLAAHLLVKTVSDQKATSENVEELRYPSDYTFPALPTDIGNLPADKLLELVKALPSALVTPSEFETRKVGATLELTVSVRDDGKWLDMVVSSQHVRFQRMLKYDAGVIPSGEHVGVEQPQFSVLSNNSSLPAMNGERLLIGIHKLAEPAATCELFLLRVTATKLK